MSCLHISWVRVPFTLYMYVCICVYIICTYVYIFLFEFYFFTLKFFFVKKLVVKLRSSVMFKILLYFILFIVYLVFYYVFSFSWENHFNHVCLHNGSGGRFDMFDSLFKSIFEVSMVSFLFVINKYTTCSRTTLYGQGVTKSFIFLTKTSSWTTIRLILTDALNTSCYVLLLRYRQRILIILKVLTLSSRNVILTGIIHSPTKLIVHRVGTSTETMGVE